MDQIRLIAFIVFSMAVLLLWEFWQKEHAPPPQKTVAEQSAKSKDSSSPLPQSQVSIPSLGRVTVHTDLFTAEIDEQGGDLRKLSFHHHHTRDGKPYVLLSDEANKIMVIQSGFTGDATIPNHKTRFMAQQKNYNLDGQKTISVTLEAENNDWKAQKIYSFKQGSYEIMLRQTIVNKTSLAKAIKGYVQILRDEHPAPDASRFIHSFTGGAYYIPNGGFEKVPFKKFKDTITIEAPSGWVSMLQHYFVTALIPNTTFQIYGRTVDSELYAMGALVPLGDIAPTAEKTIEARIFTGPKLHDLLKSTAPGLEYTVDYGLLTIIAMPLFWALKFLHGIVHNWGVAIIILTILIKMAFYPLSQASYRSMAKMRALMPRMQRLREEYKDDRMKLQEAMMNLYRTEKVNPLGGCLPVVVQIPVFIALYWMILESAEMREAPFFGWIHDLSAPDPYFILPVVMGISMLLQTRLNPPPPDPMQAKVMMFMPLIFTVFFAFFPSGLVLYWITNNIISISQQWYVLRQSQK